MSSRLRVHLAASRNLPSSHPACIPMERSRSSTNTAHPNARAERLGANHRSLNSTRHLGQSHNLGSCQSFMVFMSTGGGLDDQIDRNKEKVFTACCLAGRNGNCDSGSRGSFLPSFAVLEGPEEGSVPAIWHRLLGTRDQ